LFVEMDPAAVDVNIHPAKREVKFHREREVRQLMAQAVREELLKFHAEAGGGGLNPKSEIRNPKGEPEANVPRPKTQDPRPKTQVQSPSDAGENFSAQTLPEFSFGGKPASETTQLPAEQRPLKMGFGADKPASDFGFRSSGLAPTPSGPVPLLHVPLRLVGVIGRLYVVLESDRGLVLLDQHAAHERILFEQMLERLEQKQQADSQKLLLPETVELSARDANFIREQLATLTRLGVGLSEFGERTFLLDALPPFVKVSDARKFVLELVDELKAAGQEVNSLRLGEHVIAKTVCRHAVKANDPLAGPELENLVNDLRRCAMPYTCPHGRPTLIEMNFRELEKKFGRAQ